MVLVDTSVWVRALSGKQPHRADLDELLAAEAVLAHELVYGELLIGDAGGARAQALASYLLFAQAPTLAHAEVVTFVRSRRLSGRGIGWIDAHLLASAMVSDAQLYTVDQPLHVFAKDLGVQFKR